MEQQQPFLSLSNITVRYLDKTLFQSIDWQISKGTHWAIVGPSGSGKTALLNTILGKFNIINGSIHYHFYDEYKATHTITDPWFNYRNLIAFVGHHHTFKNLSNTTTDFYYQQRFNSMDADNSPTVKEYLEIEEVPAWMKALRLENLLEKRLIKLSNGETRRVMIARSLFQQPQLLMLDNPFIGLDVQARKEFTEMINNIIAGGTTVIMSTTPTEVPQNITNVLTLEEGKITGKYTREEFIKLPVPVAAPTLPGIESETIASLTANVDMPVFDTIVKMEDIHVKYGENTILKGINWVVKPNDKWALLGPNGAGKSTLLSLINGDNPQAYANKLWLFDRKRGSGESIWDIKKKIGFVSPELHQYFTSRDNCLQVVCSGYSDIIGTPKPVKPEQEEKARKWMEVLGINQHEKTPFKQVPESAQRLTLLARALVKNPPLLIFDEPCQGLDDQQKQHFKHVIEQLSEHLNIALIFVTHYEDELPSCVDKFIRLNKGEMVK
ncbi:molybdate transport system ATP-binding protein [Chitinophaga terrae (ex Kim and Jung 2007)]|uniref:Molybdate transport system ATP-binding protein n=1 Tax=Chitinophaga terrae (ex Kim and Jung 2007) TaxID=408074 RepID=A0A1H4CU75_9BACT|nr:ATP-binding cassette domain-containing protein [Chitinophaga terrae (ex Kim and Jung 2007)]MDQ0105289.1 molybdate transport system ATP-binding protein [Chitinophaga terrae (ex Kim and Jung 2007)]GEP90472.1 molybdenum ABC transporter ATP-binding protein [Chitinophaga terrae (ex Kim and Jung 2007)]SEA63878.1 molybdate transport system ATP-binding protein [Chitinophaga terrae (ex Kim and Jung 2007)]